MKKKPVYTTLSPDEKTLRRGWKPRKKSIKQMTTLFAVFAFCRQSADSFIRIRFHKYISCPVFMLFLLLLYCCHLSQACEMRLFSVTSKAVVCDVWSKRGVICIEDLRALRCRVKSGLICVIYAKLSREKAAT